MSVSSTIRRSCALLVNGDARCWGVDSVKNGPTAIAVPTNVSGINDALGASVFRSLVPARILDTRSLNSTIDNQSSGGGPVAADSVREVVVRGRGGVSANASSVVLNITVTEPSDQGYVTVFPCGSTQPEASNVNYVRARTIANLVVAKIGVGGKVCLYTYKSANLIVDVNGYFEGSQVAAPLEPQRLLDTRRGLGAPKALQSAGSTIELTVLGVGGVPPIGDTVVLNVTVDNALADGYLTVFPCRTIQPNASNVNFKTGQTIANAVFAKVGVNGKVCIYSSASTDTIVDVNGWLPSGATYESRVPARVLDTRAASYTVDGQFAGQGKRVGGSTLELPIAGRVGIDVEATTVMINVTVTEADADGYITVFPCGAAQPNASNVNFLAGDSIPNAVVAKVGVGGKVCLFTSARTHLLVDVTGSLT